MKIPKVIRQNEGVRVVVRTAAELVDEGKDDKGKYVGGKWGGLYLRAPDIYFRILEKAGDKMVRLGDVADVRRGFTTGANEFFYLKPLDLTVKEVAELREKDPTAPVRMRNGADWEGEIEAAWLHPLVKSFKEIKALKVRLEDLRFLAFIPPNGVRDANSGHSGASYDEYPNAREYIAWGEAKGYSARPTCSSRNPWWDVGERQYAPILVSGKVGDRYLVALNDGGVLEDKVMYGVFPRQVNVELLVALLNSQLTRLHMELSSRQLTGAQAIADVDVNVWQQVFLPNPSMATLSREHLKTHLHKLLKKQIPPYFLELGFELCKVRRCKHPEHPLENIEPERLSLHQIESATPNRLGLDIAVLHALGLGKAEVLEVYQAVVRLVKDRLTKANTTTN